MQIRLLDLTDKGYALASWRESHKAAPGVHRVPWSFYKHEYGEIFAQIINAPTTKLLGAYATNDKLLGWLAMTPGKRVHTLHWVQVKFELDGIRMRRRGIMTELLNAAELGPRFVYTLHARRDRVRLPDGSMSRSLDESLVAALQARGIVAAYTPLKEWVK